MDDITGRDRAIIARALAVALEALSRAPDKSRPESEMRDMEVLLAHYAGTSAEVWRTEARALLSRRALTVEIGKLAVAPPEGAVVSFPEK